MTIRTKVLAGLVDLSFSAVIRQLRLDFGAVPVVKSESVVQGVAASDHYHYKTLWGSSHALSGAVMRVACSSAWAGGNNWWVSLTEDGDSWTYSAITATTETPADYTRPGIFLTSWNGTMATGVIWYLASAGLDLHRRYFQWTPSTTTWAWTGTLVTRTVGASLNAATSLAVGESDCIVIGFKNGRLWARHFTDTTTSARVDLWNSAELEKNDAFLCDAIELSSGVYSLIINTANHGAAVSILYNKVRDAYSDPRMIAGGGPADRALRIWPVGLSKINGRLWLVTWRAIEGSDNVPYAQHMALSSSADGVFWRDDGFIGEYPCFGKLSYETGDTYAYVAGNAAIYRAEVTSLLATEPASKKRDIDEATTWRIQVPKAGGATNVSSNLLNASDSDLDTSPLFRPDNQLQLILSSLGETDVTLFTGYLVRQQRDAGYTGVDTYIDQFQITGSGPIARLSGQELAYQPLGGIMYNSPTAWFSDFDSDGNSPRLSVAGLKGTWNAVRVEGQATYTLKGEPNVTDGYGLSTVPRAMHQPAFNATIRFKAMVEVEGVFLVFLYEDEENYWRAGFYDDVSAGERIEIQQIVDGEISTVTSTVFSPSVDTWYSMHLSLTPEEAKLWLVAGETLDFSAATTCTFDMVGQTKGLPVSWHAGACVLDRMNDADAIINGTVTKSYPRYVWDQSKNFTSTVLGKYLRCNNEWRRIVDFQIVQEDGNYVCLTVDPPLSTAPPIGTSYGVYADEGEPYMLVRDLMMCESGQAWTIDDISTSIMELSGVGRTVNFSDTLAVIASSTQYRDFAVTITGDTAPSIILYASGRASYTGWIITVGDAITTLEYVFEGGAAQTRRKIPNSHAISVSGQPEIRIVLSDDSAYIFADGKFLAALPNIESPGSGYVAKNGTGTYTVQEFGQMRDMFAWASTEKPNQCLARLLRGRHAKLRELADGTVELSKFDSRTDLGAWDAIVTRQGPRREALPSIIGMVGAEFLGFYLDPTLARNAYRFRRGENPTVETELETVNEARLTTRLAREQADGFVAQLYSMDPEALIEDVVELDSTDYIIDGLSTSFQVTDQGLSYQSAAQLRKKIDDPTPGVWGTDKWGETYYG